MTSVCARCGGRRARFDHICPACGHRAEGEGLLVAWLLSSDNLGEAELAAAAERVRAGQPVRPSDAQLARARRALGRSYGTDPGLSGRERVALLACALTLTPLPWLVAAAWWWTERPRAALQALAVSLPAAVAWVGMVVWTWTR